MTDTKPQIEVVMTALGTQAAQIRAAGVLLSAGERQRAARFAFDRDRRRYIAARALLRRLLGERLGERPEAIEFVYGRRGKPALAPRFAGSGLHFNLSHCDDVAVYAFARAREVGVDIEKVRPIPDADEIAKRFFSRRENLAYRALAAADRGPGFFNCWTRKEAFIKAHGSGLSLPLDKFVVSLDAPARLLRTDFEPEALKGWTLHDLSPGEEFAAALALEGKPQRIECWQW